MSGVRRNGNKKAGPVVKILSISKYASFLGAIREQCQEEYEFSV